MFFQRKNVPRGNWRDLSRSNEPISHEQSTDFWTYVSDSPRVSLIVDSSANFFLTLIDICSEISLIPDIHRSVQCTKVKLKFFFFFFFFFFLKIKILRIRLYNLKLCKIVCVCVCVCFVINICGTRTHCVWEIKINREKEYIERMLYMYISCYISSFLYYIYKNLYYIL